MKYILLALFWITFCVLHSAMVSITVADFLKKRLGSGFRYYRLFYNIFAVLSLVPVFFYSIFAREEPFYVWEGWMVLIEYVMVASGVFVFIAGGWEYDFNEFIGISQIKNDARPASLNDGILRTSGLLGLMRHPCYTGIILVVWARDLDLSSLIINSVITLYLIIGTHLEERKLILELGDAYRDYQKKVSMFIPIKWAWSKIKP